MTAFPAEPGTWLVSLDETAEPIPIIGWEQGSLMRAWPILPMPKNDFYAGEAIRLPGTGAVVDPMWERTFPSEEAWRQAFEDESPYEQGKSVKPNNTAPAAKKTPAPGKPAVAQTSTAPDADASFSRRVTFGTKRLKNKSFWSFVGEDPFVFEIPGDTILPIGPDVEKITRDAFFEMRKTLTQAIVDPELAAAGDDDGDGDDLI